MSLSQFFTDMQKDGLCKNVSLQELATEHQLLNGTTPTLIFDCLNLDKVKYLLMDLSYTWNYDTLVKRMKDFVNQLRETSIEPTFYFKGNLQTSLKGFSKNKEYDDEQTVLDKLKSFRNKLERKPQIYADRTISKHYLYFSYILKYECRCQVIKLLTENMVIKLAKMAKDDERCLGIFTVNSRYLIYDTKPIFNLAVSEFNSMITEMYDPKDFMRKLGLNRSQLFLLNCLQTTKSENKLSNVANEEISDLENTRKLIKENNWDWCERDINDISKITGINKNLLRERMQNCGTSFTQDDDDDDDTRGHKFSQLLNLIKEKYCVCEIPQKMYFLIKEKKYVEPINLADFVDESLPFSTVLYRRMRRKMYGLIFNEEHVNVDVFWCYSKVDIFCNISESSYYIKYNEQLLSEEESLMPIRWKLFEYCLETDIAADSTENVKPHLLSFCCLVNYMLKHGVVLDKSELDALIFQAILVSNNSDSYKDNVELIPRYVHLSRLYEKGMSYLMLVSAVCGFPISLEHFLHWKTFNINVFINVYNELLLGMEEDVFCSQNNIDKSCVEEMRCLCLKNVERPNWCTKHRLF
ncbi:uncharacterized protein LOC111633800 isoform X2 [Centruroides sculpturatus]|uniref:uncharacterized protein LOC111633800 isoform X2 n=1 Tax=Centruroides sculpturatus TaxID=218467 RepID=UPI000C6D6F3E|nr:uncharacterized protein LOC111633800 isoform X2 [Centruroides sculpturatus]